MLETDLDKTPVSLERPKSISEEDKIKAGQLLVQAIDVFSNHQKALTVLDLASARQSITIPLGENEKPEIPVDNLNFAALTIAQGFFAIDSYQLRLRERGIESDGRTSVITQDIFWHVAKPMIKGKIGKFVKRISGKPQEQAMLRVQDATGAVWRQIYYGDISNAAINFTRPDQTRHQDFYAVSDLSKIQREILSKLPAAK